MPFNGTHKSIQYAQYQQRQERAERNEQKENTILNSYMPTVLGHDLAIETVDMRIWMNNRKATDNAIVYFIVIDLDNDVFI